MAGKSLEADGARAKRRAFAIKLSSIGQLLWVWGSGAAGVHDAANAVMQLPAGGDLIVAGYRIVSGIAQRSLTKLSLPTGNEIWTTTWPSAIANKHSAWEMVELTKDGAAVLLAGLQNRDYLGEFDFKSYGNVVGAHALVAKVPVAALRSTFSPSPTVTTWSWTTQELSTAKAARSGNVFFRCRPLRRNVAMPRPHGARARGRLLGARWDRWQFQPIADKYEPNSTARVRFSLPNLLRKSSPAENALLGRAGKVKERQGKRAASGALWCWAASRSINSRTSHSTR